MPMDKNYNHENEMDHLNILQKFGKYQIVQYALICLPTIFISMNNVNYVFVAGDIEYRCCLPEYESDNSNVSRAWPQGIERCPQSNLNAHTLQANSNDFASLSNFSECKEWIYASNNTIVAWLDLACKPWKTSFVGTVHSIGMVVGMTVGGWASDTFGRKPIVIFAFLATIIGCIKTIVPYYYGYIFIELIESLTSGAAFTAGMIIMVEISGNDKRVLSGVVYAYAIYFGEGLLAFIAMLVQYWKTIIYIICAPSILIISYIMILKESPRWLVLHNEFDKAKDILILMTKYNKINMSAENLRELNEEKLRFICNTEINAKKEGYIEVFKCREMVKRLVVASVARFSVTFIYYGLVASSVWLPGNKYTNYILTALMSFPGDILALYFLGKFGRRMPLVYGYLICGAACVAAGYAPEAYFGLKILLYLVGKLTVAACYTGIWTYTMELFPTSVRGSMFGLVTIIAGAGSMLAPLTPALDTISPVFSSLFFGASAISSSILLLFTPETKGLPLPATIKEIINDMKVKKNKKNNNGIENHGFDHECSISTHI